jgi:hypothetical protein
VPSTVLKFALAGVMFGMLDLTNRPILSARAPHPEVRSHASLISREHERCRRSLMRHLRDRGRGPSASQVPWWPLSFGCCWGNQLRAYSPGS